MISAHDANKILLIHFDVPGHTLSIETFIQTAISINRVVDALNEDLFQGSLEYELFIAPPEEGTFLAKFGTWVGGGAVALFGFVNTPVGGAYVEGLTGQPPEYWSQELGEHTGELIKAIDDQSPDPEEPSNGTEVSPFSYDDHLCKAASALLIEMTEGVLREDPDKLERLPKAGRYLAEATEGRADFFRACLEDRSLGGIGFTRENEFPISRRSFAERMTSISRRDEESEAPWEVAMERLLVTSPNWDREDRQRKWKARDSRSKIRYFTIEDEEFWYRVRTKDVVFAPRDQMTVQWAYRIAEGRLRNFRVLRVVKFNSRTLAAPLNSNALSATLGEFSKQRSDDNLDLFEDGSTE